MKDFKAVILAGGSGERFWPLSTAEHPKQFLRVFGGESLIRQSVSRLKGLVEPKNIFVITAKALVETTCRELPEIPKTNVIGEPLRRDTGAAIALATGLCDSGVMGVFSSDQLIGDVRGFRRALRAARTLAKKRSTVVTLGVRPTFPATCFGYVDPKHGCFVEKPNVRQAKSYLRKGYLWNAGMFIGKVDTFRAAFAACAAQLSVLTVKPCLKSLARIYLKLPRISFDYAVMEPLSRGMAGPDCTVSVVPGEFGWDDVGSYAAFDKYFPHDSCGNVREGPCTVVESRGNICVARSARISLLGVSNLVVVTTPNAVLVADKSRVTELKKLFQ